MGGETSRMERSERFCSDGADLAIGHEKIEQKRKILLALINSTGDDIQTLRTGLAEEIGVDIGLKNTWKEATSWFQQNKPYKSKLREGNHPDEYHIAVITFTMEGFYDSFNKACRDVTTESEAKSFRYKNYYKLLHLAIMKVQGHPQPIPPSIVVYRGCSSNFCNLKKGDGFLFMQFTSTSRDRTIAENFIMNGGGTLFIITNVLKSGIKTGKLLGKPNTAPNVISCEHHSAFAKELEILMWTLEEFTVLDIRTPVGSKNVEIHLKAI